MSLFEGSTINTPSMLCVEDYIDALEWVKREGGQAAMVQRCQVLFIIQIMALSHLHIK